MGNERRKDTKLRYSEYYGMQNVYDDLYQKSVEKQNFNSLMKLLHQMTISYWHIEI